MGVAAAPPGTGAKLQSGASASSFKLTPGPDVPMLAAGDFLYAWCPKS